MKLLVPLVLAAEVDASYRLTPGGWTIMAVSVGCVTLLLGWCVWHVLRESTPQKIQSQADIETPDTKES